MFRFSFIAVLLSALITACSSVEYYQDGSVSRISSVNQSIVMQPIDGEPVALKTVNGKIDIGKGYSLNDIKTVNGKIRLGPEVTAKNVQAVNGNIQIDEGSTIESVRSVNGAVWVNHAKILGDTKTVNGGIKIQRDSQIGGTVTTNNGEIKLYDSIVERNVEMTDGDLDLVNATIKGDVVVRKKGFWEYLSFDFFKPKLIIGPNSVVEGNLIAQRKIKLFVHESAKIANIEGAEASYYSGDRP